MSGFSPESWAILSGTNKTWVFIVIFFDLVPAVLFDFSDALTGVVPPEFCTERSGGLVERQKSVGLTTSRVCFELFTGVEGETDFGGEQVSEEEWRRFLFLGDGSGAASCVISVGLVGMSLLIAPLNEPRVFVSLTCVGGDLDCCMPLTLSFSFAR